jgi:hypothetical protein
VRTNIGSVKTVEDGSNQENAFVNPVTVMTHENDYGIFARHTDRNVVDIHSNVHL